MARDCLRAPQSNTHPTYGMKNSLRAQIGLYLGLVVLFSSALWALIIHAGHLDIGHGRAIHLQMWCPALAAFATCAISGISVRGLGWSWPSPCYAWLAYLLPLGYGGLTYIPLWLSGSVPANFAGFANESATSLHLAHGGLPAGLLLLMTYGFINSMASALGEEIGWRGFLLPRLNCVIGYRWAILLSGLIWATWHTPILLFADYNSGTPAWYGLSCFAVMIVATGTMAAWLRLRTDSLWPAAILHASHNLFIQQVFDAMSGTSPRAPFLAGEFGAVLAIVTAVFAVVFFASEPRPRASNPRDNSPQIVLNSARRA